MKVLIVKLSSLGDVVHTLPVVQDMRRCVPGVQIDWVVEEAFAPLLSQVRGLHRVLPVALRRWMRQPWQHGGAFQTFRQQLVQGQYDAVIDAQGLTKSALVSWLARTVPGTGKKFALANRTEGASYEVPTRWVADVAVPIAPHTHVVQRSRLLCAQALGYAVPATLDYGLAPAPDLTHGLAHDLSHDLTHGWVEKPATRTIAFAHGTSRSDKEWPLAHWVALGQWLNTRGFTVALPHGSAAELQRSQQIAAQLQQAVVWPRLPLDQLTSALAACAGVVGVDTGLSHIAMALDLPLVQIYNFETAWRTGPQQTAHQTSVFAQPYPSVAAVQAAWLGVADVVGVQAGAANGLPAGPVATAP